MEQVVPVELQAVKSSFIARRSAYLASVGDAKVGCTCDKNVSPDTFVFLYLKYIQ